MVLREPQLFARLQVAEFFFEERFSARIAERTFAGADKCPVRVAVATRHDRSAWDGKLSSIQ